MRKKLIKELVKFLMGVNLCLLFPTVSQAQKNNLSLMGKSIASFEDFANPSEFAHDGNDQTAWISNDSIELKWLKLVLLGATNIREVNLSMETIDRDPIQSFSMQTYLNGIWSDFFTIDDNSKIQRAITLEKSILTDRIRLAINDKSAVKVSEFEIYGNEYVDTTVAEVKRILVNQSGYNLYKLKRFTAPEINDGTLFAIKNLKTNEVVFRGCISNHIGDFSEFNPHSSDEFIVAIDTLSSYPFKIAPYLLERISYRNMVDFMDGARHYTGSTKKIQNHSWAWRDGDFYNWSMQSLVAQYLSNPEAYKRMDSKITYVSNDTFPEEYQGKWGALEPYDEDAPDIVKLIHWDADVKISQNLEHEMQKAELAHFLYAYPYLKEWLPQQNFDRVYEYVQMKWEKEGVAKASTTNYDRSENHDLLRLKTKLGTTKGEMPPGYSVVPNLMMYEVAKREGEKNSRKYFDAAFRQMEWMIKNLDWENPMVTKGQRMSEHMTMRSFAYFHHQFPHEAPEGLAQKVSDWAKVAVRRSKNLWDFRKFTDNDDWIPAGWNETGNVLGLPACALAAKSVLADESLREEMDRIVWSHFDNAFGRNPTGRHFSHDGPEQIEGVDLGWYNEYKGGIGLLESVRFVFDGSPKTNHYPNHPEIGNLGWTEGWVQFNTAFNFSMAYLANDETELRIERSSVKKLKIWLKAPLIFNGKLPEKVTVTLYASSGDSVLVTLKEEAPYSQYFVGTVAIKNTRVKPDDEFFQTKKGDTVWFSYGLGYFKKEANIILD